MLTLEGPKPPDPFQIVDNPVGQLEDIGPTIETGLQVRDHFVPTALIQFVLQHDQHTFGAGEAVGKLLRLFGQFATTRTHGVHLESAGRRPTAKATLSVKAITLRTAQAHCNRIVWEFVVRSTLRSD